jgi:predicted oxidoreductase
MNVEMLSLGCASMLGRYSKKVSIGILRHALSSGIIHFDVARSYGYGEAEKLLGTVLKGADNAKVSSKFGVIPSRKAKLFSFAKPLVRPFIKKSIPDSLSINYKNDTVIDVALMKSSLQKSLSSLKTDSLHNLFIHEPPAGFIINDQLIDALNELKYSGVVDNWGISGYQATLKEIQANSQNKTVPLYQSSMCILDVLNSAEFEFDSIFSPYHRGYVLQALDTLGTNSNFKQRFESVAHVDWTSYNPAFWAIFLLFVATNTRIVMATKDKASLDECISAMSISIKIEKNTAVQLIAIINQEYNKSLGRNF